MLYVMKMWIYRSMNEKIVIMNIKPRCMIWPVSWSIRLKPLYAKH